MTLAYGIKSAIGFCNTDLNMVFASFLSGNLLVLNIGFTTSMFACCS